MTKINLNPNRQVLFTKKKKKKECRRSRVPVLNGRGCPFPSLYCLALPTAFSHFRQIVFCSQLTPFCVCDAGRKDLGKGGVWLGEGETGWDSAADRRFYSALAPQGPTLLQPACIPSSRCHKSLPAEHRAEWCLAPGHLLTVTGSGCWACKQDIPSASPRLSLGLDVFPTEMFKVVVLIIA